MCRHIAYIGKKKTLYSTLLKHKHSLIEMAYKPKEMNEAILNADGFGIAWEKNKNFFSYKNTLPIWNDLNLLPITKNISSSLILANVRSATISSNLGHSNTHPFIFENFLFSHNGYIKNFHESLKYILQNYLEKKYLSMIQGNTDSEYLFFLILQMYKKYNNLEQSIKKAFLFIKETGTIALLNILLAKLESGNKKSVYATKFAIKSTAPSLYYNYEHSMGYYISSEKLNNNNWLKVKNNHCLEIKNNNLKINKIF